MDGLGWTFPPCVNKNIFIHFLMNWEYSNDLQLKGISYIFFLILKNKGGGADNIDILEFDYMHLQGGVCHKIIRFGENQSMLE